MLSLFPFNRCNVLSATSLNGTMKASGLKPKRTAMARSRPKQTLPKVATKLTFTCSKRTFVLETTLR